MFNWFKTSPELKLRGLAALPPKELLNLVRDPEMTYKLELAKQRGELGVLSRQTRDIDTMTASNEALELALSECRRWHATYPETDDYALVSWLEAVIADEFLTRAIAKMSGGMRVKVNLN